MKLRIPSYYKEFSCIAERCKHSCCIGWVIDIDEESCDYYRSVGGEIGERLRNKLVEQDGACFQLEENGWCPFLNKDRLCDIYIALGEESLSEVCTDFPRSSLEYGNIREKTICISCEEAGRILFSHRDKTTLEELELQEQFWSGEEEQEEEITESLYEQNLENARDFAVALLQNREKDIVDRISDFLNFCGKVQEKIIDETLEQKSVKWGEIWKEAEVERVQLFCYDTFLKRLELLEELEAVTEEFVEERKKMRTFYERETYQELHDAFLQEQKEWEYEQEQLLVYVAYRYLMKAVYDYNFYAKAELAVFNFQAVTDMDVRHWKENGRYTRADRIETARIFAREVEHCEENLECLEEAFEFGYAIV